MMRLMSKELAESLEKYPLYSQDGTSPKDAGRMMTIFSSDW